MSWEDKVISSGAKKPLIEQVADQLFPPLVKDTRDDEVWYIDYSVDSNLEAVYEDLVAGVNNEVTLKTLKDTIQRINMTRILLNDYINQKVTESGNLLITPKVLE